MTSRDLFRAGRVRASSAALLACIAACTPGKGDVKSSGAQSGTTRFEAVVRVADAKQEGKPFRGAFVEQDDGTRWVITYRAESPFHDLRDHRVKVDGTPYEPAGQALTMRHLRVASLKLIETEPVRLDQDLPDVEVWGEERLTGQFEEYTWPAGTKLEGEKRVRFVDGDGTTYFLAHGDGSKLLGKTVTLTAHRVEPSRHMARPGGPYLWVLEIEAR